MSLPTIRITLQLPNPNFEPKYDPSQGGAVNMDEYYVNAEVEVEVVQLNLNEASMRVRYEWPNKRRKNGVELCTRDVGIDAFFNAYSIVEKS